jgi:hypothetical protein
MQDFPQNELVARLEKLERQNRMFKRTVSMIMLALGALIVMGQAPNRPRTLEAERLVIRYPNGKAAIVLDTDRPSTEDHAQIYLFTPGGSPGAWIDVTSQGGKVHVNYPDGQMEAELTSGPSYSSDLRTPVGDWAGLVISKEVKSPFSKQSLFYLSSNSSGETKQSLSAGNGGPLLQLMNGTDGPAVQLLDNPKTLRALLGRTSLEIDRSGNVQTLPLSSLVLFDRDGKLLWRAP